MKRRQSCPFTTRPDHAHISSGVFTTPELATIGLREAMALTIGHSIDGCKSTFRPLLHTSGGRDVRTLLLIKLIVDSTTDKVLGCHNLRRPCFRDHPDRGGVPEDGRPRPCERPEGCSKLSLGLGS